MEQAGKKLYIKALTQAYCFPRKELIEQWMYATVNTPLELPMSCDMGHSKLYHGIYVNCWVRLQAHLKEYTQVKILGKVIKDENTRDK